MINQYYAAEIRDEKTRIYYAKEFDNDSSAAITGFHIDIWLFLDVFPKLLSFNDDNLIFLSNQILENKFITKQSVHFYRTFSKLISKSIQIRPSKWILLKKFVDMVLISIDGMNTFDIKEYTKLCEVFKNTDNSSLLISLLNDNLKCAKENCEEPDQVETLDIFQDYLGQQSETYETVPLILAAALAGADKCFEYFLDEIGAVQAKIKYEDVLIDCAIIGGSRKIIGRLGKLNWRLAGHWKTAVRFHRLDLFIYLRSDLTQLLSKTSLAADTEEVEAICVAAINAENTELLLYLKQMPDFARRVFWKISPEARQKNFVINHLMVVDRLY